MAADFIQNFSASYSPLHRHLVGHKQQQQTQSLIQEVTSDSFLHTVMDSQRDVLLLYYSAWCGFCSVLNHVFLQLARLFQGNGALTVARVNVGRNDLPWEFMVDHLPSVLFFPRHRSQTLHSLSHVGQTCVCFILNRYRFPQEADEREVSGKHAHDGSQPAAVHSAAHWPRPWEESGHGVEPKSLLEAELRALQREVFSLHQARERLSQQLAVLWRENRRLALHTHTLETQNAELQEQSGRLETLYREKTRQLTDTVHRLQELADASEELLKENTLHKVLLNILRERDGRDADTRDTDGKEEEGQDTDKREGKSDFIQNFSASYSPLHRHLVGHKQQQQTQSLIQEVTSDSFLHTVMDSQRDVLLLYYSAWCGFCSVLNHVFLQLARLFQGNGALTVARVNVGRNDLPWEFMVDHLPSVLFFPRHRKQMSVKFPENTPMTVPNLLRFILQHTGHAPWEESGHGVEPKSLLEAELRALQREVFSLHQARERLSQQLAVLWRENRRLALHTHTLETQNAELQEQSGRLETLYREKTRQLTDTVHRLQELADASEELLKENTLLKVLLNILRERDGRDADTRDTDGKEEEGQDTDKREGKCEAS
ncbi:thioredoxin domain-containing 11 [Labeo rohita]|uniref:Thioredoxin domain-containing 11 n=1 Tax=Labeo rohita TaxID=84645 RepID=A0A498NFS9_LABRO|nr:thioredoxin domain-containing 11 [Labeo rohita]